MFIFWVTVIGVLAISAIAARSSISEKIVSTGSDGGKVRFSTRQVSSRRSVGVTSPYVMKRCVRISGIVLFNLLVPGVCNA